MRYICLVFASLFALGCGMGRAGDPGKVATLFSPPSIATLMPSSVPVNSVPFTMTVNGSNFGTDAVVFWNGSPQFTVFVTSNQVMANVTADDLMFWGPAHVYVRTGAKNSNTVNFEVTSQ